MARSSRQDKQFGLRIPERLRVLLDESAKKNNRSTTSELLTILENALCANVSNT